MWGAPTWIVRPWARMDAVEVCQIKVAQRAGVGSGHLSQIMSGQRSPPPGVRERLHVVLFQRTQTERVMPAEVKVLGWRKGERRGGWCRAPVALGAQRRIPPSALGKAAWAGIGGARRRVGLLRYADGSGVDYRLFLVFKALCFAQKTERWSAPGAGPHGRQCIIGLPCLVQVCRLLRLRTRTLPAHVWVLFLLPNTADGQLLHSGETAPADLPGH